MASVVSPDPRLRHDPVEPSVLNSLLALPVIGGSAAFSGPGRHCRRMAFQLRTSPSAGVVAESAFPCSEETRVPLPGPVMSPARVNVPPPLPPTVLQTPLTHAYRLSPWGAFD